MKRAPAGRIIYDREGPAGWAVVVMPDFVLIDSYHGPPHLHTTPGRKGDRKVAIRVARREEVLRVVRAHVEAHQGVDLRRLMDELVA